MVEFVTNLINERQEEMPKAKQSLQNPDPTPMVEMIRLIVDKLKIPVVKFVVEWLKAFATAQELMEVFTEAKNLREEWRNSGDKEIAEALAAKSFHYNGRVLHCSYRIKGDPHPINRPATPEEAEKAGKDLIRAQKASLDHSYQPAI